MAVNVRRGGESAVAEPFLYRLHADAACDQNTCTTVPQFVKTNDRKIIAHKEWFEVRRQGVGADKFAHFIYTNIISIQPIIVLSVFFGALLLLSFQIKQNVFYGGQ